MEHSFTIQASHPSLAGHFPSNPIVPGVIILDEVINIIQKIKPDFIIDSIPSVKFTQPLLAGQKVIVEIKVKNDNAISFLCTHNDIKIVVGQLATKSTA